MGYQDEEIIKAKKAIAEEEKRKESKKQLAEEAEESIYGESVHIIGKEVRFARRTIPELRVSIYMPESFFLFADDIKKLIYPAGNTPSHVFGGEDINFQMSLNQTEHRVPDSGIKEFVSISAKMLEAVGPKVTIVEKKTEEQQDHHVGILSFVSRAVDMMVYNVQFYLSMEEKLLIGNINFPSKYKKRLIPLAQEIIGSLEILEEK